MNSSAKSFKCVGKTKRISFQIVRRRMLEGGLQAVQADEDVVGTSRVRELERRVRELERLLGRKTMEAEILKEALDVARVKKPSLQLPSWNDRKDGSP